MAETQRTSDIYGILLDPTASRVLMLPADAGNWTLPHFHIPDKRLFFPMVDVVCDGLRKLLPADVTVLRGVYAQYSDDRAHVDLIYTLENQNENWTAPAGAKWIDRHVLETLPLAYPEHRAVIDGELAEAATINISELRPPWARPGWFKAVSAWMREKAAQNNYILTTPVEQFKSWGISCLLRAQTDRGTIFFKVSTALPLFGNEPVLLTTLSERYPDYVPMPIAIEPTQRWMLMSDFGDELGETQTPDTLKTAFSRFAQLQVQTVSQVDELLTIGCLDRRLDVLASQIDPLLNDEQTLAPLPLDERANIRSLGPRLKAMCSELAAYRVPSSLNHGDLHGGNITEKTLLFFDWTDACIAHPFLDLSVIMMDLEGEERELVLDAYLSQWTTYEPMARLREMWKLAEPLGALHQTVSYQHILATLEPTSKREFESAIPLWLRRVMQTMPE